MKAGQEIKEYSNLAFEILQLIPSYIRSKNIISDLFKTSRSDRFETIIFRLTIIDSYYSTQMNKRFFGLEDLAEQINKTSGDDRALQVMCYEFLSNPTGENGINKLFNGKYGKRKTGHDGGQAASLISKYLYFLNEYEFPIYDNLAKISYPLIKKKYPELNIQDLKKGFDYSYFNSIKRLNLVTEINSYNKLDNLLWLIGKLVEGSLSLILNKERYLLLLKKVKIQKGTKSRDSDLITREYIQMNIDTMNDIFSEKEIKFLKYTFALKAQ